MTVAFTLARAFGGHTDNYRYVKIYLHILPYIDLFVGLHVNAITYYRHPEVCNSSEGSRLPVILQMSEDAHNTQAPRHFDMGKKAVLAVFCGYVLLLFLLHFLCLLPQL